MSLKENLLNANKEIVSLGLVKLTWGNVSARQGKNILIKPSGVKLQSLDYNDISEVDFDNNLLKGLKQSVDTPSHIELYKSFKNVNAVVHTHSKYATSFAQAKVNIPCLGTTHADYFRYEIPVVGEAKDLENYEKSTGESIVNFFIENSIDSMREHLTNVDNNETEIDLFPVVGEDRESYPCSYCSFQTICYDQ